MVNIGINGFKYCFLFDIDLIIEKKIKFNYNLIKTC